MYSNEETECELLSDNYHDWLTQCLDEYIFSEKVTWDTLNNMNKNDSPYFSKAYDEFFSGQEIVKNIIRHFRMTHPKIVELTTENIESLLKEYSKRSSKKASVHSTNFYITLLVFQLQDLIRINKYMNRSEIIEFDQIGVINRNYCFIFKLLDFWDIIPEENKKTKKPANYLRSMMDQSGPYLSMDDYSQRSERLASFKKQ